MNVAAVPERYMAMSREIARRVPAVLSGRGLEPAFSDWLITIHRGQVWLFGVLRPTGLSRLERYTAPQTLHHLSTALRGLPTFASNTNGLRLAFLLSRPPRLPREVMLPDQPRRGMAHIGVDPGGRAVSVIWRDLGHILVAGATGAGKSNFLRLITYQAQREGTQLLLADLDGTTFPMLEQSHALLAPIAHTPNEVRELVSRALAECDRRAALYQNVGGFPDNLCEYNTLAAASTQDEPLPRLLVILDEFNATVQALGGARGAFATQASQLGWRGRKFGVDLVFAAQDFSKAVIGRVRDQVRTALCFRVRTPELARAVSCPGAHRIPESLPGRAITDRWGTIQTYYLDKSILIANQTASPLSDDEQALVVWAVRENGGRLSLADVQSRGFAPGQARRLAEEWERRGWLEKDAAQGNCRVITEELAQLANGL